jgi:hypothetical protein
MENKGRANANFLSLITAPAKRAMAICGANPNGRPGTTLYKAATTINTRNVSSMDFLFFIALSYIVPVKHELGS